MIAEKKNITIVGEHIEKRSWFALDIKARTVIKGLTFSEVRSKGLGRIYKERTGHEAIKDSLTSYYENQYPKRNGKEKEGIKD